MDFSRNAGALMERTGRRTAFLQVIAVALLCVLIVLYLDLSAREKNLNDGVHENAMWAVFQLDREVRNVEQIVDRIMDGAVSGHEIRDELALRLDILYSRVDLLNKAGYVAFFTDQAKINEKKTQLVEHFSALEPDILRLASGDYDQRFLNTTHEKVEKLALISNQLVLTSNSISSITRSERRDEVMNIQRLIALFISCLLIAIVLLILSLRHQISSVREAGLSMQAMARKLSEAYGAADAGNRAKSQFMATIGHEIRTPLNAILGTAELMEYSELSKPVQDNVRVIRSSGEALLEVLNEILDYAKIEHGRLELEERAVNVEQLVNSVSSIMSGRAAESGNRIVVDIPQALQWPWVKADPTRVRQVLLNLTSNAIKFTDEGTITLRVRERTGFHQSKVLRFEVKDSGIGIDEEGQKRLFKPFSQVDASISRRFGGTGLGLTICKEIADRLNGSIGVSSTPGKGSTFWFEIPVSVAEAVDEGLQLHRTETIFSLTPLRILLVEDNKVNQQVAMRFLNRLGQTADVASNGAVAVDMAAREQYDLILMDMQMPEMDGITATREIRGGNGLNKQTAIIAMTANASEEDRRACREVGMTGFEAKPVSLARLQDVLVEAGAVVTSHETKITQEAHGEPVTPLTFGVDPARRDELVEALGEEIFEELLGSFFNDTTALLAELHAALAEQDVKGADQALHTIKGAAANVGFMMIAEMAEAMRSNPTDEHALKTLQNKIDYEKAAIAA